MAQTVGAHDARTHFARLLNRVAKGETFTVTRRGVPVADLIPVAHGVQPTLDVVAVVNEFRRLRATVAPLDLSLRQAIYHGRHR
jgi:prevent-host-death family protein